MYTIVMLAKPDVSSALPLMFHLLSDNMNEIAPTGNTPEQDYQIWKTGILAALECKNRHILLIKQSDAFIGYFQYYADDAVFKMEEIQIDRFYWGSGAFHELYQFLAGHIPEHIMWVEAYAHKQNRKSQEILRHLGLEVIGENKNGNSWHFRGDCQKMLDRYR